MDFLEGFLMGPSWSDTEYESRRHTGFHFLAGLVIAGIFAWLAVRSVPAFPAVPWPVPALLLLLFMLVNPMLCRSYYRRHLIVRFLILLALAIKQLLAVILLFAITLPRVQVDLPTLAAWLMNLANEDIATMTDRFNALNNAAAMILGLVTGSLLLLLRISLLAFLAILAPVFLLLLVRWLQRVIDWLICRYFLREVEA